jgi:predicted alpha/beta-fold hydrolase
MAQFNSRQALEKLSQARSRIQPCVPPVWATTGHRQTLFGHLLPSTQISRERGENLKIALPQEKEFLASTYLPGTSNTVVYLFHGLGGTSDQAYMLRTARIARELGHHVFLNNHRGCGAGVGLAQEPYHSGRAEDLSSAIEYGRTKLPNHHHIAIGFSLSANALLLLCAGFRASVLPDAAITVNAPIMLEKASVSLSSGFNLTYNFNFLLPLKSEIRERQMRGELPRKYRMDRLWRLRDFDEVYTAPAGGFRDRSDYYETCSARQYLPQLQIPTVVLTAEDDPFIDVADYKSATVSSNGVLHIEKYGGHMGYLSRPNERGAVLPAAVNSRLGYNRWLDYALLEYLRALT